MPSRRKLTDAQAEELRSLKKHSKMTYKELGKKYGLSIQSIWRITTYRVYKKKKLIRSP